MSFSMTRLLIHNDELPRAARDALFAATYGPSDSRDLELASAAWVLHSELGLGCDDARELLGLEGLECR
jgi:hypothetical protein